MLPHQQPAHVGEEEPPLSVVGVRVGLGELVVDAVVPGPLENVVLITGGEEMEMEDIYEGGRQSINTHKQFPPTSERKINVNFSVKSTNYVISA